MVGFMIITLANWKGGVGKSTSAVHLGTALMQHGTVRFIDTDPQGALVEWSHMAGRDFPHTVLATGGRLTPAMTTGADFIIVDTPPSDPITLSRAIDAANVVLIPTTPSHGDVSRTLALIDQLGKQGIPATVLLTSTQAGTVVLRDALEALSDLPEGITLYEHTIPQRQHFKSAYGTLPKASLLHPYDLIARELTE
jgi:chromosome partitioning protein